jgi:hypothetical protein
VKDQDPGRATLGGNCRDIILGERQPIDQPIDLAI